MSISGRFAFARLQLRILLVKIKVVVSVLPEIRVLHAAVKLLSGAFGAASSKHHGHAF